MRLALVHDYLNQYGGAERVLEAFCEMFPDAPVYTLFYDKEKTLGRFEGKIKQTSFLNKKIIIKNHRPFIPLMPLAASRINLSDNYDLILSSSAGYGKGVRFHPDTIHITYCHTPLRYAWEYRRYFKWGPFLKMVSAPLFYYLKNWDLKAAQKTNIIIANSHHIAQKIKNYYKRETEVIYPPVDLKTFYREKGIKKENYYLAAGRLMSYKRFDLIIQTFNKLNLPLIIAGDGPELKNLKKMVTSPKIQFRSFVTEDELRGLYNGARALIFPQIEDFGLVAAEAQACGTPVIAYSQGGAKEIIEDGVTGVFFHRQTPEDLESAIKKFQLSSFNENDIINSAQRFSKEKFKKRIMEIVNACKI